MPKLNAKPEALDVEFAKSAVVLVDMQNAFASKGGLLDIAEVNLEDAPRVVQTIGRTICAARSAGVLVAYLRMAYKPDLSDAGGARSPNCYKELAMRTMRNRPEYNSKLLVEGTWDAAIVDELAPLPGDLVITKTRYSGFAGTTLDSQLRARGIQFLFFAGIAANVCVESTLRDAYFLDYWPILLADATMPAGGPDILEGTLFNVESFFGWTVTSEELRTQFTVSAG